MKLLVLGGALAASLLSVSAHARSFTGSYSETHNTSSVGLEIGTADFTSGGAFSFSLDPGQSTSVNLYQIYANETTVNVDDTVAQAISTVFDLSGSAGVGTINGNTVGVKDTDAMSFGPPDNHQFGEVSWYGPASVSFADGSKITISLNDAIFNEGEYYALNHGSAPYSGDAESNGAPIVATFSYEAAVAPISGAPEPGTWLLMMLGVGMLGGMTRGKPVGNRDLQAPVSSLQASS